MVFAPKRCDKLRGFEIQEWMIQLQKKNIYIYTHIFYIYIFCICLEYFFSLQYLHALQTQNFYLTHSTVHVQPNCTVTDIPLPERERLKDDHLSMSLTFFNLPSGIRPNEKQSQTKTKFTGGENRERYVFNRFLKEAQFNCDLTAGGSSVIL